MKKVLVVDDDKSTRTILRSILEKNGYIVTECSDGNEAWDRIQKPSSPQLILTDWLMPNLNGIELCEKIRKMKEKNTFFYIIIITLNNKIQEITRALNSGADDHVSKPFVQKELIARIAVGFRMIELQRKLDMERAKRIHLGKMAAIAETTSGIAHEINNPLFVLQGNMEKIINVIKNKENTQKAYIPAENMQKSINRIQKIIKGLYIFSEKEIGIKNKIKINDIMETMLNTCKEKLKKHKINITYENKDSELFLDCSPSQISQCLFNIVKNSWESIENKQEKWIHIIIKESQDNIQINVLDSGDKLEEKIINKIFMPFFTHNKENTHTGLGLSIAQGYAHAHNGEVIYDKKSKNTCFVLILPKQQRL